MTKSLKSSIEKLGPVVTEIVHFRGHEKKTFRGVKTDTIEESSYTHFELENGTRVYINNGDGPVNFFEIIKK